MGLSAAPEDDCAIDAPIAIGSVPPLIMRAVVPVSTTVPFTTNWGPWGQKE